MKIKLEKLSITIVNLVNFPNMYKSIGRKTMTTDMIFMFHLLNSITLQEPEFAFKKKFKTLY